MDIHGLDRIFKPQRIALFGANENPHSVGSTVLRNLVGAGFRGVVYPVHPTLEAVLGIHCYPDAARLPRTPDLAVICSPRRPVPQIVRECGEAGVRGVVIVSAGFREIGAEGRALEEAAARGERAASTACASSARTAWASSCRRLGLNASFAPGMPKAGHVAFISQSGALCTSVLDWALDENIGFSYFVSVGNMLDVDFGDLIDYFGEDEQTESIILYIESLGDARHFMTAARAFARTKPIVAYKAGRFAESAKAAASHTGALAGEDAVYDAAFERAGIARVFEIGDIFDCAELVGRHKPPRGPRLAIVTNAGGPGVMATDALIGRARRAGGAVGGDHGGAGRDPAALLVARQPGGRAGGRQPKRFAKAAEIVLADPGVDAVLVILTPQAMTNPTSRGALDRRTGGPRRQADPGRLAGRQEHARGRPDPEPGRGGHLRDARGGGARLHDAGRLRAQPGGALRDAARHPGALRPRPDRTAAALRVSACPRRATSSPRAPRRRCSRPTASR